jgi:hypothetical protein
MIGTGLCAMISQPSTPISIVVTYKDWHFLTPSSNVRCYSLMYLWNTDSVGLSSSFLAAHLRYTSMNQFRRRMLPLAIVPASITNKITYREASSRYVFNFM